MPSLKELFSTPVSTLHSEVGHIVEVSSLEKPKEGFQKLLDNHVLSAPCYDEEKKEYCGFLDMRDFVSFVVFFYHSEMEDGFSFVNIIREGLKKFNSPVDGITSSYLARRHAFKPVKETATIIDVIEVMATKKVHRVPVLNEEGRVINVITQSSIINFLQAHVNKGENFPALHVSIHDAGVGGQPVLSVTKNSLAIDTFRLLETHNISGVAVVDDSGCIVGATSGQDLKYFLKNPTFERLNMNIFDFLKEIRAELIDIRCPAITVHETDPVGLAIGKIAATRVHRVFAIDNKNVPQRVLAVSDLTNFLLKAIHAEK